MTTLIAMFIQVLLSVHPGSSVRTMKTVVADGSVWVDVYEDGQLKSTVRLCDHNLRRASSALVKGNAAAAK